MSDPPSVKCDRVRFLSLASHDLRAPLANIRSYVGLLLNGRFTHEPRVQRGLETILRNADRALALTQDFFDASRADLGALAFERAPHALDALLAETIERLRPAATAAAVSLELSPTDGLPAPNIDAGRVAHALEAFIQHHLSRAQGGERIQVLAARSARGVRVEVRREGAPLFPEDVALLFAREERALRERKLEDALRLSLARQEIEAQGGSVGVEADASGTTLCFTLPL